MVNKFSRVRTKTKKNYKEKKEKKRQTRTTTMAEWVVNKRVSNSGIQNKKRQITGRKQ